MNPTLTLDDQIGECLKSIETTYDYELCTIKNSFSNMKGAHYASK